MTSWVVTLLVVLVVGGLAVKPLRRTLLTGMLFLGLELLVIIIWPRTLIWLAEIALRMRGIVNAF